MATMSRRFAAEICPTHRRHPEVRAPLGEPRRMATGSHASFEARKSSDLRMTAPVLIGDRKMASIHKEILIDATPADVWDALRDFGALHTRLAPGFVLDTKLDGEARIVTFANGNVARELLVDC